MMRTETAQEVTVARVGAVLTITLNRPDRLNAVTTDGLDDLADLLEETAQDETVRVVVVTGAGRAFSSGADLGNTTLIEAPADDAPGTETILAANRCVRALRAMPQPTVAAVNGPAVGVGCSLALGCDLTVAAESAYFLLSFTSIALMPDGGATVLVPAAIGRSRAMEMALVPERLPAARALEWGLIYRVVPNAELAGTIDALAERLATGARHALAATKHAVNDATLAGLERGLDTELAGQAKLLRMADFREAVSAFGERRKPQFTGG
jgi:enoyl-CoA hydratase